MTLQFLRSNKGLVSFDPEIATASPTVVAAHSERICRAWIRAKRKGKIGINTTPAEAQAVMFGPVFMFFASALFRALLTQIIGWALRQQSGTTITTRSFGYDS